MSRTTGTPRSAPEILTVAGSRRSFLRAAAATGVAAGSGGVLLTACEGSINETPDDGDSERARTVIFDHDGGRVQSPDLWNPFVPGFRTGAGFHQSIMEPLFILDYGAVRSRAGWARSSSRTRARISGRSPCGRASPGPTARRSTPTTWCSRSSC